VNRGENPHRPLAGYSAPDQVLARARPALMTLDQIILLMIGHD
jgi:hypothetical protein